METVGKDNGGPGLAGLENGHMRNSTTAKKKQNKTAVCQTLTWLPGSLVLCFVPGE